MLFGQKKIDTTRSLAFVFYKDKPSNLIVIPNIEKYHFFKIYRKTNVDTSFLFVVEKKKPPLPMRYNISPYSVSWEDKDYHTREVNYKIFAFNKRGMQICEMTIIWETD